MSLYEELSSYFSHICPPHPIHPNFNNRIGAAYSETKDTHIALLQSFIFSTFSYALAAW